MGTRSPGTWRWLLLGLALVAALILLSYRLPAPLGPDAASDRFSADRALRIVRRLCDEVGMRPNGTPAQLRAAELLVAELQKLPGVHVELQRVGGVHRYRKPPWPFPPFVYRTVNVVARLEGRTREALLLDAHYDTKSDSVGASDDAMAVAAIIEVARALAAGPKLERSIVLSLNGAEEVGMLGAAGFIQHRFAKDVRAYLYVDGGPRGKPVVLGAGPGNGWLLAEYAAAARLVSASVVSQDLVESGLLRHSGDFLPFHEAGLIGVDLGAVDDFWSVHTDRDRPERIDRAALQLLGENLLAATRRLASGALPGNIDPGRAVYHDVAGRLVLVYSSATARVLALAALGLAAFALVMALRRRAFTLRQLLGALGRLLVIAIVALLAAVLVAAVLSLGVQRPHGWFARPVLAVWGFGAASFAAAIGMMAWRRRRRPDEPELLGWAAALLLWALLLLLMTIKNLGSAYLPLWWTAPQAAGLLGALYAPKWRRVLWLISFLPGAVLVLGLLAAVFPFIVADTGLMPAPAPLDIMIAVLVALTVVALLPALLALIGKAPHLGRISLAWALFAVVGAVVMAAVNPYSFERPKRITATVAQRGRESGLYLASHDPLPLGPALRGVPEAVASPSGWSPLAMLRYGYRAPARSPSFEAPRVEVLSSVPDRARGVRVVRLRIHSGGPRLQLKLPRAPVRGWSLGPIPEKLPDPGRLVVVFEGAAPEDKEVTLELVGSAPVEVELVEVRAPSSAPEVQALKARLPPWTALDSDEVWSVTEEI